MLDKVIVCSINNENCSHYDFGKCNKILNKCDKRMVLDGQDKIVFDQKRADFMSSAHQMGNIGKLVEMQNFIHNVATRKWYENQKNK